MSSSKVVCKKPWEPMLLLPACDEGMDRIGNNVVIDPVGGIGQHRGGLLSPVAAHDIEISVLHDAGAGRVTAETGGTLHS